MPEIAMKNHLCQGYQKRRKQRKRNCKPKNSLRPRQIVMSRATSLNWTSRRAPVMPHLLPKKVILKTKFNQRITADLDKCRPPLPKVEAAVSPR